MKKLNVLTRMLLLVALLVGSTSVWADDTYVKVTTAAEINTNSTYIIVAEGASKALGTWSSGKSIPSVDVSISSSTITVASDAESKPQEVVLSDVVVSSKTYSVIKHANEDKYLQGASSATDLKAADSYNTDASKWTISIAEDEARIFNKKQTSNAIIYRESTYYYFKNFASSNVNNTEYFYGVLYKKVVPVTISDKKYATFASDSKLDFSGVEGLYAYTATVAGDNLTFTKVTGSTAAGEGLLLYSETAKTYNVPVATGNPAAVDGNRLVRGTGAAVASDGEGETKNYVLSMNGAGDVNFYLANGNTVPTSKAYLKNIPVAATSKIFLPTGEDETDGIRSIENSELRIENSDYYNLAGQRVGKDYKGIVIVNGKKFVRK